MKMRTLELRASGSDLKKMNLYFCSFQLPDSIMVVCQILALNVLVRIQVGQQSIADCYIADWGLRIVRRTLRADCVRRSPAKVGQPGTASLAWLISFSSLSFNSLILSNAPATTSHMMVTRLPFGALA